jgi:hypothetical protein
VSTWDRCYIFKIFSAKNLAKNWRFLTQNKAKFGKKFDYNIGV